MTAEATLDQDFVDSFRHPAERGNWVRNMNPIIVFLIFLALAITPMAIPGLIAPTAMCLIFVGISLLAGVGSKFIPLYLKLFLGVGLILFVLRAAFIGGGQVLFTVGPISPTVEGVMNGLRFSLAVMVLCGALTLFFSITPMKFLMLALEARGVTPRATYVVLASFQSIADLGTNARIVMEAQKSRGIETDGSFLTRLKAFFPILAPVFLAAMNQTEERAIALDARAFNSKAAHTHLVSLRAIRPWEIVVLLIVLSITVLSIVGAALSWF